MGVLHGAVDGWGKQKTDADLADGARRLVRRNGDANTERFQQIGAAALARYGTIAVLGHAHARARNHKRGDGRYVECAGAVPARAARIQQRRGPELVVDGRRHLAHGARETDQFVHRLALHPQGHQESRDLGVRGLAGENGLHGRLRIRRRQVLTFGDALEVGQKGHDNIWKGLAFPPY